MSKKILKSTLLFSGFVLFAQVIGLVRDLYLVRFFGVGQILDTYYLAFKIPDLMNVFYSVFLGSVIFIPLLIKIKDEDGVRGMRKEVSKVGSLVLVLITLVAFLLFLAMPNLAHILAPTWSGEQLDLLVSISRILLIAQIFFPIGIIAGAIGMVQDKPLGMAVSGAVYNIFILLGAIFLTPYFGIYGVVYGIILGAIFFAFVQILPPEVRSVLRHFRFEFKILEWLGFIKQNLGRFFTVLLNQVFYIVLLSIAAASGPGGVTIFNNAFNIYMAIFFVIGSSFATAIMPHNSRLHVQGRHTELKDTLHASIVYMWSVSIFFVIFCLIFAKNIIEILYYFSNLKELEILQMTTVFAILSLCIPLLNLSEIARKYMYSSDLIKYSATTMASFLIFLVSFNKLFLILGISNLMSLSFAFLVSSIFALIATFSVLNYLGRIEILYILKNTYKSLLIFLFTVSTFILIYPFITENISTLYSNYFFKLSIEMLVVFGIYISSVFTFNDKITKDILFRIYRAII